MAAGRVKRAGTLCRTSRSPRLSPDARPGVFPRRCGYPDRVGLELPRESALSNPSSTDTSARKSQGHSRPPRARRSECTISPLRARHEWAGRRSDTRWRNTSTTCRAATSRVPCRCSPRPNEIWFGRGDDVGARDIVHRDEVPRLVAVAENRHRFAFTETPFENRNHARVRRRRILARAEDVEITLAAHRETESRAVTEQQRFAGEFGRAVRTDRILFRRLADRADRRCRRRLQPTKRRRCADAVHPCGFGHVMSRVHVQPIIQLGIADALLHADERGEMDDRRRALRRPTMRSQASRTRKHPASCHGSEL